MLLYFLDFCFCSNSESVCFIIVYSAMQAKENMKLSQPPEEVHTKSTFTQLLDLKPLIIRIWSDF